MSTDLTITGGATGVAARTADMRATAEVLDTKGDVARQLALQVAAVAVHEAVLSSQILSPDTGLRLLGEVGRAQLPPEGLAWIALEYEASAAFLRGAATVYEETDAALAALDELGDVVMGVVLVNGGLLTAGGIALLAVVHDALPDALADAVTPDGFAEWLDEVGEDPLGTVMGVLYDHPWMTDSIISGLPVVLGWQVPGMLTALTPWIFPPVPLSYEQIVAGIITGGGLLGLLQTGTPKVTEDEGPGKPTPADSLESMFDNISSLGEDDNSEVRVTAVPDGAGGYTWLVEIPGTQEWSPEAGANPADLTANLHLMAGSNDTAMQQGVLDAIDQAMRATAQESGIPLSQLQAQPMTVAGHSQGGIVAAALAADPSNGLNITQVVTGGSPVGNINIPADVNVLSIEHAQDPVHHLDGNSNPRGANWTTVVRDIDGHSAVEPGQPFDAHAGSLYSDTAGLIDEQSADDPALAMAMNELQQQFDQADDATVHTYDIEQEVR